jgi:hypothetical protein
MHYTFTKFSKYFSQSSILTKVLLLLLIASIYCSNAMAGGTPVGRGRLLLSPSFSYFFNSKYWDKDGHVQSYTNNGKFNAYSVYVFAEYGLSRRLSLIASVPVVANRFHDDQGNKINSTGLGDSEFGARYYFANINYKIYFSTQATVVVPLYHDTNLGYNEFGSEVRFIAAGGGEIFGTKNYFFDVEGGVRQYFSNGGPVQLKHSAAFGVNVDKKSQFVLSTTGVNSISNFKTDVQPTNPSIVKDYVYEQLSLSYGYNIQHNINVYLSGSRFIYGRNTGIGSALGVSLSYKY